MTKKSKTLKDEPEWKLNKTNNTEEWNNNSMKTARLVSECVGFNVPLDT